MAGNVADKHIDLETVQEAAARIAPYIVRTPMLRYDIAGRCELLLKPETLQPTGAFKLRGAFNFMLQLPPDCPGVVAHSSGNHAQAVARAARVLGLPAIIVMPSNAPERKRSRTESDGAQVVIVGPDSDERAARAREIAESRGLVLVPPYDHPWIAAGQGTAALELLEDAACRAPGNGDAGVIDRFYAPVSGGGLMSGCATVVRALCPTAEIVGVEPEGADDTRQSLEAGERCKVPPPETIADGLRVRTPGEWTWTVLRRLLSRVELVSDQEMIEAMRFALDELRLVLEPSGAASLALALREGSSRCGVILSGGNVEPELLARVIAG